MPYLMGGFPTLEESAKIGQACVAGGADLLELGVPYSDPLADGPVIHEAGTRALAAGASLTGVLEVARTLAPSVPVVLMCYANMVFAPGAEAFVERLAQSGASGLIVPDLPLEEAPRGAWRLRCPWSCAGAVGRAHHATGAACQDRGASARLSLHGVGRRHDRRAGRAVGSLRRGREPREGEHRRAGGAWLRDLDPRARLASGAGRGGRRDRRHAPGARRGGVRGSRRGRRGSRRRARRGPARSARVAPSRLL